MSDEVCRSYDYWQFHGQCGCGYTLRLVCRGSMTIPEPVDLYNVPPVDYYPEPHQYDWHNAPHRFKWLCGGIGSGKTYAGAIEACMCAIARNPGKRGMIIVPDYDTFWDVNFPLIEATWPPIYDVNRRGNKPRLLVHCGDKGISEILVRSAMNRQNVARIDGPTIAWAWMDEPSRMLQGHAAWQKVIGRIRQKAAWNGVFVTGSPRGVNWIAKAFAHEDRLPDIAWTQGFSPKPNYYIRAAKTSDNRSNEPGYLPSLIDAYGELYAEQELSGDILAMEGRIYPNWYKTLHVVPHEVALALFETTTKRTGGVDWGWTNPACNVYAGWTDDSELITIDEWYHRRKQKEEQGYEAYKAQQPGKYDVLYYYADPSEPGHIDKWRRGFHWAGSDYQVTGVIPAPNEWEPGVDCVRNLLHLRGIGKLDHPAHPIGNGLGKPSLFVSERCVNIIREFPAYREIEVDGTDKPPREGATGECHSLDAIRYMAYGTLKTYEVESTRVG